MKYYAVIDTNVIVSSMLKHDSIPGKITDLIISNTITPLLNDEIIGEYLDVLTRNKFDFNSEDVSILISFLKEKGLVFE